MAGLHENRAWNIFMLVLAIANAVLAVSYGLELSPVLWACAAGCKCVQLLASGKQSEDAGVLWAVLACLGCVTLLVGVVNA